MGALQSVLLRAWLAAAFAPLLAASTFSFTGTLADGSQVQYFSFTTSQETVIYTLSYGGGTNAAGTIIPPGGFDPLLTLYDADGNQIGSFEDSAAAGGGCLGSINPGPNGCLDAYFDTSLNPGTYTLALSQFTTTPNGSLADGFTYDPSICAGSFCDSFDNITGLTGNWALDIVGADSAAADAPEPRTFFLLLAMFAALPRTRRTLRYLRR